MKPGCCVSSPVDQLRPGVCGQSTRDVAKVPRHGPCRSMLHVQGAHSTFTVFLVAYARGA